MPGGYTLQVQFLLCRKDATQAAPDGFILKPSGSLLLSSGMRSTVVASVIVCRQDLGPARFLDVCVQAFEVV